MTDRILELAEQGARLRVHLKALEVERAGFPSLRVPLEDLAVLVVSHPDTLLTAPVLSEIAMAGGSVVVCDGKHLPQAMLLPLATHFTQGERFRMQAAAKAPLLKRLWQQIIQAKIKAQGALLARTHGVDQGLSLLWRKVRSGDPENLEAQAARRYWTALFDDAGFRRNREAQDQNRYLNYGYAVLRAMAARSLCASGLHPALGLHHHNRYDPFALADDLMEPFRPFMDEVVLRIVRTYGGGVEMTKELRAELLSVCHRRVLVEGEDRSLGDSMTRSAQSLAASLAGTRKRLTFPEP